MLKSIAAARSECTTRHENKASYNTDHIVPDLTDFLAMIEKRSEHRKINDRQVSKITCIHKIKVSAKMNQRN